MTQIDYYLATISPSTYLAGTELEAIAARHGASITYRPFDIMACFARTGGTPPKDRHPNRQVYRLQDMERRAKRLGKPLNLKWQLERLSASSTTLLLKSDTDCIFEK